MIIFSCYIYALLCALLCKSEIKISGEGILWHFSPPNLFLMHKTCLHKMKNNAHYFCLFSESTRIVLGIKYQMMDHMKRLAFETCIEQTKSKLQDPERFPTAYCQLEWLQEVIDNQWNDPTLVAVMNDHDDLDENEGK